MNTYNTISRDLIEIRGRLYKIARYFGDIWLINECNTKKLYIFDRNVNYSFLAPKESVATVFVFSDLLVAGFFEVSEKIYKGHTFKLVQCEETKCLYVVDLDPLTQEVKHLSRVPSNEAELLLDERGNIVGVYHEELDVIHVEKGKFAT